MISKKYLQLFFSGAIIVLGIHLILTYLSVFKVDFISIFKLDSIVFFIFILGAFFMASSFKKNAESFVNRFLILTTFQMLGMMAILLAMVYVKFPEFRIVAFHTISIFTILLTLQSIFLVRGVNTK